MSRFLQRRSAVSFNGFQGQGLQLHNGSEFVHATRLRATNLRGSADVGETLKVDASGNIRRATLDISDVDGLQSALDAKLDYPNAQGDLNMAGYSINGVLDLNSSGVVTAPIVCTDDGAGGGTFLTGSDYDAHTGVAEVNNFVTTVAKDIHEGHSYIDPANPGTEWDRRGSQNRYNGRNISYNLYTAFGTTSVTDWSLDDSYLGTSIVPTGFGNLTAPPNFTRLGDSSLIEAAGILSCGAGGQSIRIKLVGGTNTDQSLFVGAVPLDLPNNLTDSSWQLNMRFVNIQVGPNGTADIKMTGNFSYDGGTVLKLISTRSVVNYYDTTIENTWDVTASFTKDNILNVFETDVFTFQRV